MVRPLLREPARTLLTISAVALGVAVVLAIDLAGAAATGSFRGSMETLAGDNDLEVTASGGVPEELVGTLATLPYPMRVSPRIEDYAVIADTKKSLPLIGLDLVAGASSHAQNASKFGDELQAQWASKQTLEHLGDNDSVWVGSSLGYKTGDQVPLLINDQIHEYTVRGVYSDSNGNEAAIVMDLSAAQRALRRYGRVDRILLKLPENSRLEDWRQRLRAMLPAGVEIRPQGAGTDENRRMLAAFRWNLRLLSYISLVVGAFLIYNTISVSVVRRRPEIGIVRALGASRGVILFAFVGEAVCFGLAGAFIALPLGRFMATGAVRLMASTVESLYVSSRPGPIELSPASVLLALAIGVGVAVASAYSPAREASEVAPIEAMECRPPGIRFGVHQTVALTLDVFDERCEARLVRARQAGRRHFAVAQLAQQPLPSRTILVEIAFVQGLEIEAGRCSGTDMAAGAVELEGPPDQVLTRC